METKSNFIFSAKGDYFFFYLLYSLFTVNHYLLRSKALETKLWDLIKLELFYIAGACQHSGNCCQRLILTIQGQEVRRKDQLTALLKKKPNYDRFEPQFDESGKINYFSCQCLTPDNFCSDYENRPKLCHNYPFNRFFQSDYIPESCGYSIKRKSFRPWIANKRLKSLVEELCKKNKIWDTV